MRIALLLALVVARMTFAADSGLAQLDFLIGEWRGKSTGEPGEGTTHRVCEKVLNAKFVECRTTTVYPPQEKNPKGETHVDRAFFSYDRGAKKLRLRQFHGEGFVNSYVQGEGLAFETDAIENIPAGWRARETYTVRSADSWSETFELAEPGKAFAVYSSSVLERVK
jgi:hypothetical protein